MNPRDYFTFTRDLDGIRPDFQIKVGDGSYSGELTQDRVVFKLTSFPPSEPQILRSHFSSSRNFCVVPLIRIDEGARTYELIVYIHEPTNDAAATIVANYRAAGRIVFSNGIDIPAIEPMAPNMIHAKLRTVNPPSEAMSLRSVEMTITYTDQLNISITDNERMPPTRQSEQFRASEIVSVKESTTKPIVEPTASIEVQRSEVSEVLPSSPWIEPATAVFSAPVEILNAPASVFDSIGDDDIDKFRRLFERLSVRRKAVKLTKRAQQYITTHLSSPMLPVLLQLTASVDLLEKNESTPTILLATSTDHLHAVLDALE